MAKRQFYIDFNEKSDHAIQYLIAMIRDARQVTLDVLEKLTEEELDWQFKPGWNTMGSLLSHISAIDHYFRVEFVECRKLTEEEIKRWEPGLDMGIFLPQLIGNRNKFGYVEMLTDSMTLLVSALQSISLESFTKRIPEYDPVTGSNVAWALYHKVEDEIYHRGQISILRKLYHSR